MDTIQAFYKTRIPFLIAVVQTSLGHRDTFLSYHKSCVPQLTAHTPRGTEDEKVREFMIVELTEREVINFHKIKNRFQSTFEKDMTFYDPKDRISLKDYSKEYLRSKKPSVKAA